MSGAVEVVDGVHTDGQSVEKNPTTNKMEEIVADVLIHGNSSVCVCER